MGIGAGRRGLRIGAGVRSSTILGVAVAAGCGSSSDEITGGVHVDWWRPKVAGEVSITKGSKVGTATPISLRRDLGMDHDDTPVLGADLDWGRNRFSLEYTGITLRGSTTNPEDFIFHDKLYPAGDPVSADLNVPSIRANWSYALWQEGLSAWRAGLGARLWTFDMTVKDAVAGNDETRRFSHAFPLAISELDWDLTHGFGVKLLGDVAGLSTSQLVYEAGAALEWRAAKLFGAELGWKYQRYDFNESTNDGDFNLSGPYIALRFRF
jgi:hypothetical protein